MIDRTLQTIHCLLYAQALYAELHSVVRPSPFQSFQARHSRWNALQKSLSGYSAVLRTTELPIAHFEVVHITQCQVLMKTALPVRYLQPCDFVGLLPAVLPVGLLDLRRVCTQRPLCPLPALWGGFWASGCQHPQSVRTMSSMWAAPTSQWL